MTYNIAKANYAWYLPQQSEKLTELHRIQRETAGILWCGTGFPTLSGKSRTGVRGRSRNALRPNWCP